MKMEDKLRLIDAAGAVGLSEEDRDWYRKAKDTMITRNYKRNERGLTDEIKAKMGLTEERIRQARIELLKTAEINGMEKLAKYLRTKLKEV